MNCDVTITYPSTTVNYQYVPKHMKRITRTIDRYDKDGKLIEREVIVEEHEDVERMVYELNEESKELEGSGNEIPLITVPCHEDLNAESASRNFFSFSAVICFLSVISLPISGWDASMYFFKSVSHCFIFSTATSSANPLVPAKMTIT